MFNLNAAQAFENAFTSERKEQIGELISTRVSPASRSVLLLHYFHGLSFVEIAEVLEIPVGTVKSRLAYGLQSLRRAWESV